MSSSACNGLKTCLETRIAEHRVLRLKLAPPAQPSNSISESLVTTKSSTGGNGNGNGGWGFLLSLDRGAEPRSGENGKESVYVHPQATRSTAKLSAESLAMCTESLGSETGSDSGDDIALLSSESSIDFQARGFLKNKKYSRCGLNFPPPLGSIGGVRVRPRREAGRLVLVAVRVTKSVPCFQTERSNGRLRLCLLKKQEMEGVEVNSGSLGGKMGIERPRKRCNGLLNLIGSDISVSTR